MPIRVRGGVSSATTSASLGVSLDQLACSGVLLGYALRGFGLYLFESGAAKYWLIDAINAAADQFPEWRGFLVPAWQTVKSWSLVEPSQSRVVVPAALVRALVCLALLWGWPLFAGLVLLGFSGMLRPDEFLSASRRDLVFPTDRLEASGDLLLRICNGKTRRIMRVRHARGSDPAVISFLFVVFGGLQKDCPLAPWGASAFRSRWNALLGHLGVPHSVASGGPTPGSLRGSGATDFYLKTEDIPRICWRGRRRTARSRSRRSCKRRPPGTPSTPPAR